MRFPEWSRSRSLRETRIPISFFIWQIAAMMRDGRGRRPPGGAPRFTFSTLLATLSVRPSVHPSALPNPDGRRSPRAVGWPRAHSSLGWIGLTDADGRSSSGGGVRRRSQCQFGPPPPPPASWSRWNGEPDGWLDGWMDGRISRPWSWRDGWSCGAAAVGQRE